ncbi:MAG: ATP-binding protein [Streptococcaceae bacterium]|jgi:molecular chaperone HtpG|nr:ATP-binding protein [Streptococcaceae bacterium]
MVQFGKNILENLTTGMYSDARVMYREYVQNSCDAIDAAVNVGIIDRKDASIDISIDADKKEICIRDNGSGIRKENFQRVLSDIANSDKKRAVDKGFRGIGRLCGLAYCDELQFISSSIGEDDASIMTWDAKKMRIMLNDERKHSVDEVLGEILKISSKPTKKDEHFFELIMVGVSSHELLDKDKIRDFLAFEIPVPYPNKFIFNKLIYDHAKSLGVSIDEYNIFVNEEQVFKDYKTKIYSGGKVHDEIKGIEFQDFYDEDEKLFAWMWYGLSSLNGQIKAQGNMQRGLRLRKGNIQIGSSHTLRQLFKDGRGNEYYIGEVFAVHPDLVPNARRDYFNENRMREKLESCLREYFDFLWRLCNIASEERSAYKKINDYRNFCSKYEEKITIGFSGDADRETMNVLLEEKQQAAKDAQKVLRKSAESKDIISGKIKSYVCTSEGGQGLKSLDLHFDSFISIRKTENGKKIKTAYITDDLSQYTKETRRVVGKIYDLINQNEPDIAEKLIAKIHAGLKTRKD